MPLSQILAVWYADCSFAKHVERVNAAPCVLQTAAVHYCFQVEQATYFFTTDWFRTTAVQFAWPPGRYLQTK